MNEIEVISREELLVKLEEKRPSFCLVDVRERHEFADFNWGGLNVPAHELGNYITQLSHYKVIVVACSNGMRSGILAKVIKKKIPSARVLHLEEGIW